MCSQCYCIAGWFLADWQKIFRLSMYKKKKKKKKIPPSQKDLISVIYTSKENGQKQRLMVD